MSKPIISTIGCRLNDYESAAIERMTNEAGLEDTVIINSCAVTGEALRKTRQEIRRVARLHPNSRRVVTGCAAQIDPDAFANMAEVDLVLGNQEKTDERVWKDLAEGKLSKRVMVSDIMAGKTARALKIERLGRRTRAYVQVQNGCDHRCTFCIIPYGRGNSRSVPAEQVLAEIAHLESRGFKEVVLTGVDITSWGADLPEKPRLGSLVREILYTIPSLERLRISSIDSIEVDREFEALIANEARLMPCLHLSLQAGDDLILKRMKRRHLRADAIAFCTRMRKARPDIVFGADIIAGFPTETEAMFQNSLKLVEECDLSWLHVFPFSARAGTPAARMPQVDKKTIKARAARLRQAGALARNRHFTSMQGKKTTLLMESTDRGRTPQFAEVQVETAQPEGAIVPVQITGFDIDGACLTAKAL